MSSVGVFNTQEPRKAAAQAVSVMGYRLLLLWVVCCHLAAATRVVDVDVADSQPLSTCLSRPTIVGDDSALSSELGYVTVVSLIQASSDYSRRQAGQYVKLLMNRTIAVKYIEFDYTACFKSDKPCRVSDLTDCGIATNYEFNCAIALTVMKFMILTATEI